MLSCGFFQVDFDKEYDIIAKIGEGWFSRVYLTEHRGTREEIVLKAINSKTVAADEFLREYQNSHLLSAHKNVLTVYDVWFQVSICEDTGYAGRIRHFSLFPYDRVFQEMGQKPIFVLPASKKSRKIKNTVNLGDHF